jgi:rod shape-determining protein MreD
MGLAWLLVSSSFLPVIGLGALPLDPVIPLLVAFCLSGRRVEAVVLALGLGLVADSLAGAGSSRLLVQYLVVVLCASPAEGHVVLRDRWMPTLGVVVLTAVSGLAVYLLLSLFGAELPMDLSSLPSEVLAAGLASALLWPLLVRLAGGPGSVSAALRRQP